MENIRGSITNVMYTTSRRQITEKMFEVAHTHSSLWRLATTIIRMRQIILTLGEELYEESY